MNNPLTDHNNDNQPEGYMGGSASPDGAANDDDGERFEQEAKQLVLVTSGSDENVKKTGNVIQAFVTSYAAHKDTQPLNEWLISEFRKYPVWQNEEELNTTASEVIHTVDQLNQSKVSLENHLAAHKSEASWLANRIDQGASAGGIANVGLYAARVDGALQQANESMANLIRTKDGVLSQAYNLDGFIAEQHHVDTFNIDAASKGSNLRAKVLTPEGAYGKNSMDVGVYRTDANGNPIGKPVKRYQLKYGQDDKATQTLWDKGDYRGQQKLVPADQASQIEGSTDRLSCDGVESKPLTKAEAKAKQEKAQLEAESTQYEWNDVNKIEISKNIGKQALVGAAVTASFHGARILGRRVWNMINGIENPTASEDLQEFFMSSIKGATNTGVQVAVSGGVVVAAKNGWLGSVAKNAKASVLVSAAYAGMENAKILYQFGTGKLTGPEALDALGRINTGIVGSLVLATEGAALGAALGTVFGPVGTIVGGIVGGVVGGIAGSTIATALYEGAKGLVSQGMNIVRSVASSVSDGIRAFGSGLMSLFA